MAIEKRELRDALGKFATGVCIVTAISKQGEAIGMTINSFSSVSLEPPLVLWSIQYTSECFETFNAAEKFAVNILAIEQEELSNAYARKGGHGLVESHYRVGKTGSPILRDVLASFECRQWARYPGGDHLIIVGEVLELVVRPSGRPLLFHTGKYGQIH